MKIVGQAFVFRKITEIEFDFGGRCGKNQSKPAKKENRTHPSQPSKNGAWNNQNIDESNYAAGHGYKSRN
jgi:hypothetical protein